MDLTTYALCKNEMKNIVDGAPEAFDTLKEVSDWIEKNGKQADWNQNDETQPDYIKNRICYEEPGTTKTTFLDLKQAIFQVIDIEDYCGFISVTDHLPKGGTNVNVVIDGSETIDLMVKDGSAFFGNDTTFIGNLRIIDHELPDTGETFLFMFATDFHSGPGIPVAQVVIHAAAGSHDVSVYTVTDDVVVTPIDRKFMPESVIGIDTTASGDYGSHAEGNYTTASGETSHAEGHITAASGETSHAEGEYTEAIGRSSHAEGHITAASGETSHAEGDGTTASGDYGSHAEGYNTTASGYCSHAEGHITTASGDYGSHAEGNYTTASGDGSHAEGDNTTASGNASHAEGYNTTASGNGSHAEGYNTTASGYCSHTEGQYNIDDAGGRYAHISGNGNDKALSNAYTLDWDGNAWYQGSVLVGGADMDAPDAELNPDSIVIKSSTPGSVKRFRITVTDDGVIKASLVESPLG